jgi:hypothetical protein
MKVARNAPATPSTVVRINPAGLFDPGASRVFYKIGIRRRGCRCEDESYGGLDECLQAFHDAIELLPKKLRPALHVASPDIILSRSNLFNIAHFAVRTFNFDAR